MHKIKFIINITKNNTTFAEKLVSLQCNSSDYGEIIFSIIHGGFSTNEKNNFSIINICITVH